MCGAIVKDQKGFYVIEKHLFIPKKLERVILGIIDKHYSIFNPIIFNPI